MTKSLQSLVATLALITAPLCANAGIFSTNFDSTTNSYTGGTINYSVDLGAGTILNPGDFLTLYDAGFAPMNLTGAIGSGTVFRITTNLTDTPAPGILGIVDDPTIPNIRFTYIFRAGFSGADLGTFMLPDPSGLHRIVSIDDRHNNISDGGLEGAPLLPVATVPETGSNILLLGLAMVVLVAGQRARVNRHQVAA